jgi:antitoxin VapB
MALSIKNREYEEIARELARVTGKSITEAGLIALQRELERQKSIKRLLQSPNQLDDDPLAGIRDIQQRYAALPTNSAMSDDEVLGYDEFGAPTR